MRKCIINKKIYSNSFKNINKETNWKLEFYIKYKLLKRTKVKIEMWLTAACVYICLLERYTNQRIHTNINTTKDKYLRNRFISIYLFIYRIHLR